MVSVRIVRAKVGNGEPRSKILYSAKPNIRFFSWVKFQGKLCSLALFTACLGESEVWIPKHVEYNGNLLTFLRRPPWCPIKCARRSKEVENGRARPYQSTSTADWHPGTYHNCRGHWRRHGPYNASGGRRWCDGVHLAIVTDSSAGVVVVDEDGGRRRRRRSKSPICLTELDPLENMKNILIAWSLTYRKSWIWYNLSIRSLTFAMYGFVSNL